MEEVDMKPGGESTGQEHYEPKPAKEKPPLEDDYSKIELDPEVVSAMDLKMLKRITEMKYRVLKNVADGIGDLNPDNERIYAFTALASATEDGVVKATRLKLEREKNQIDAQGSASNLELARELLRVRNANLKDRAARKRQEVPDQSYKPSGEDLTEGEVVKGEDHQNYKEFKKKN